MAQVVRIETPELGDRTYLVHDGEVAGVIDPQRDFDRVLEVAASEGVRITHVFETHIHNDYVTGGLALAEATGASYVVAADDEVAFDRVPAADGSRFEVGRLTVTAISTPGHTPHHLSYRLAEEDGDVVAVFTGGSMLFGSVGRTDLIGPEMTEPLTRAQYRSVRRLADELPATAEVHPTHGFGSFCSAGETSGDTSTIGRERTANVAVTTEDEDRFVENLIAGLNAYPRYYAHMGPANLSGPGAPDLDPPRAIDPGELRARIDAGEWVVDLRARRAFARNHATGTISFELGTSFATFLGWTMPWGTPLTLIGETADQVAGAQRQLVRIGIDRLAGAATGDIAALAGAHVSCYETASFEDLRRALESDDVVVLDVRRPDEWSAAHIEGAVHIPFWELESRVDEIPAGTVWVHCAAGFRAAIGASIVDRAGRKVVLVDDDWSRAAELHLPLRP